MEEYIQYYESSEWSEEEYKDFDDDGITEHMTVQQNDQEHFYEDELLSEEKKDQLSMSESSNSDDDPPKIGGLSSPKSHSPPSIKKQISPNAKQQTMGQFDTTVVEQQLHSRNKFEFARLTSG